MGTGVDYEGKRYHKLCRNFINGKCTDPNCPYLHKMPVDAKEEGFVVIQKLFRQKAVADTTEEVEEKRAVRWHKDNETGKWDEYYVTEDNQWLLKSEEDEKKKETGETFEYLLHDYKPEVEVKGSPSEAGGADMEFSESH